MSALEGAPWRAERPGADGDLGGGPGSAVRPGVGGEAGRDKSWLRLVTKGQVTQCSGSLSIKPGHESHTPQGAAARMKQDGER